MLAKLHQPAKVLVVIGAINWLVVAIKLQSMETSPVPDLFAFLGGYVAKIPGTDKVPKQVTKYTTLKNVQMVVYTLVGLSALILLEANKDKLKPKLPVITLPKKFSFKKEKSEA